MTAYRDDAEALRARVAQLEDELASARAKVARLEGRVPRSTARRDPLFGAPLHQLDEASVDGPLDRAALEALARVLRARTGHPVSVDAAGLKARARGLAALDGPKSATADASGRLRLETDVSRLPVVLALGPALGLLASMPLVLWQFFSFHDFEEGLGLGLTLALSGAMAVLTALGTWLVARGRAQAMQQAHDGLWATLLEVAQQHHASRVRVEASAEATPEEAAHDEARRLAEARR